MTAERYRTLQQYQKYVKSKDERTMDEICIQKNTAFQLQVQQEFMKEYVRGNWDRILLYHQIGSGKTCTAITMAEEMIRFKPQYKVKVILPARLKTNFIDELMSPCGMEKYITQDEHLLIQNGTDGQRKRVKANVMRQIEANYEIMSFEKFKTQLKNNRPDLASYIREWTKNTVLVIDEAHNMMNENFSTSKTPQILEEGILEGNQSPKGFLTICMRLLSKFADPSCKFIFMTATPIFDNIAQLKELVYAINPEFKFSRGDKIADVIQYLEGRVSYFPGISSNAYPSVSYITHSVPFSKTQDELSVLHAGEWEGINRMINETFLINQRQIAMAVPEANNKKLKPTDVVKQLRTYAPKVATLLKELEAPGKHVVYSNFVKWGLEIVEEALQQKGWVNYTDVRKGKATEVKGKVYAVWDGNADDYDKQLIKAVVNSRENLFGDKIRVVLGSPSIKEGISFKHIQHMHILDPLWNWNAKVQVEGRAIRFCSHVDINPTVHKPLKRHVAVHLYTIVPREKGKVKFTCDQYIYSKLMPQKQQLVEFGERALKKIAIDRYLFRELYKNPRKPPRPDLVKISEHKNKPLVNKVTRKSESNTCPSKRRPDKETGKCPDDYPLKRPNVQGFACCYKQPKKSKKDKVDQEAPQAQAQAQAQAQNANPNQNPPKIKITPCPKDRIPINGECSEGFELRNNKSGVPCCYKIRKGRSDK